MNNKLGNFYFQRQENKSKYKQMLGLKFHARHYERLNSRKTREVIYEQILGTLGGEINGTYEEEAKKKTKKIPWQR